jgi:arylsulfatase
MSPTPWKAVTNHATISGWSHFGEDEWELYHTDVDRSECHNLAEQEPGRLRDLVSLWYAEAGANQAFPLDDRSPIEIVTTPRPVMSPPRNRYVYYPGTAEVPSPRQSTSATGPMSSAPSSTCPSPGPKA